MGGRRRGGIVSGHDLLLILPVSSVVLLRIATVGSVRWMAGLILLQFVISERRFSVSNRGVLLLNVGQAVRYG